ncbi:MAG: KH domain-containing protein [Akkermansiaceae bacterium]|nr:KH domain-containing protein [Akkermansiaceae bacterium]NNM28501.1 KH domain-containing protein [Akkermansiaceae bacterium]
MREITDQMRNFLQFIALKIIEHPEEAQLRVAEVDPKHLSFRLVLAQADVAQLIGKGGFTAGAIRNILNAAADRQGVKVTLRIHSQEEEQQRIAALEAKEIIDDGH